MIVGKTSANVLAPTTQQAWRDTGYERWECRDTGRMIAVGLTTSGIKWRVVSVYAPDRTKPAWLKDLFLERALVWRDETLETPGRSEVQVWAGHWNAYIGKDAEGARGIGAHLLPCSTKEMGRKLRRWTGEAAHPDEVEKQRACSTLCARSTWAWVTTVQKFMASFWQRDTRIREEK